MRNFIKMFEGEIALAGSTIVAGFLLAIVTGVI